MEPHEESGMQVQAYGWKTDRRTNTMSTAGEGAVQWFPRQKIAGGSGSAMQRGAVMSILLMTTNCGRGALVESCLGKLPVTQWWAREQYEGTSCGETSFDSTPIWQVMLWVAIGPPSGVYVASLAMEPAMPMYVAAWLPHDLSGALC